MLYYKIVSSSEQITKDEKHHHRCMKILSIETRDLYVQILEVHVGHN